MSASPIATPREDRQRDLWERTAVVAGRLNRAQGELVAIAEELITDGHWGDGGFKSPQHYLVVRAGLSPTHAGDVVRVARRRSELKDAAAALDEGALSLDQVAVVARAVPPEYQASMTELARNATVPQLRRAVARHAFPAAASSVADFPGPDSPGPDAASQVALMTASEQRACASPELSMHYDADGRFQLRYSAPATIGALVEQAIREAKDALFLRRRDKADPDRAGATHELRDASDSSAPTYADAVEEIANRSLGTVTSKSRAARYRVYLHLSTDGAWVGGGHAIPLRLLGRFISDGVVQPVWETQGRPVSVGRKMRILPARTRRLIEDRDRGCRFPGCPTTGFVEIHHLDAWADGGRTDEDRQVSLCTVHHDGIDRGDFTMTGDPTRASGLVVTNRFGVPVRPPRRTETAAPMHGDPPVPAGVYSPPTGESLHWHDVEVAPDADPRPRPIPDRDEAAAPSPPVLSLVAPDWLDDPHDGMVYDSYRRRS